MNQEREPAPKIEERGISSVGVLFGRLMWFIIGPAVLMFATYGIVTRGSGWLSVPNAIYFGCVALMILGRRKEQSSGCATLATGEPATWEHYRRYVRRLLPVTGVVWVVANVLGNHILNDVE